MSRFVIVNPLRVNLAHTMAYLVRQAQPDIPRSLRQRKLVDGFSAGFVGEQAMLTLLKERDVIYQPTIAGADNGDLVLNMDNGTQLVADCKLNCNPRGDKLLVPAAQAEQKVYHLYIALRIVDTHQIEAVGYTHAEELEIAPDEWRLPIPSLYCDYENLYPIENLLPLIAPGRPREVYPPELAYALQS